MGVLVEIATAEVPRERPTSEYLEVANICLVLSLLYECDSLRIFVLNNNWSSRTMSQCWLLLSATQGYGRRHGNGEQTAHFSSRIMKERTEPDAGVSGVIDNDVKEYPGCFKKRNAWSLKTLEKLLTAVLVLVSAAAAKAPVPL